MLYAETRRPIDTKLRRHGVIHYLVAVAPNYVYKTADRMANELLGASLRGSTCERNRP